MKSTPARLFFAVLSLGLSGVAMAKISTESPFVPKNGQALAAPTENSPIELRGVMQTREGLMFGIYEPASQKGTWVKADEKGNGYVVKSFDAGKSSVSIEYQGRVQTLTLKEARFDGTVAAVPMIGGAQTRPAGSAPVVAANPAEEAKRLENVANEVRRRRAARQAATTTTTPAAPTQGVPAPAVTPATP
ncbi:hypothetical protein CMV30_09320 [Nibricoccus aquaticus]|uniref:Uncharacterized protein n=1 Tax=Nibricoccus aquaticus TaxID=2576891 RepID=A0A290QFM1_9BACT|nr:hypothetical protein [Nibricoccus aquaticus]ATC64138.1 hypothetical protein CMV30_09320 [Nibricoccus aquaticus]